MADVPIPRNHNYRVSAFKQLTEVNRWASEIDARIVEILKSLGETTKRVNVLTTRSTPSTIGSHAPQHYPGTGTDPMLTAAHTGGYGLTTTVGTGDNLLRSDARLLFPSSLAEYSQNTTVTLSAIVGTSQALTGNLGELQLRSANNQISVDKWLGAGGGPGVPGDVLNFDSSASSIGTNLTTGVRAAMRWDTGTYSGSTFRGGLFQVNTATAATYTNVTARALEAIMLGTGLLSGTNSFTERVALKVQVGVAIGASTSCTDTAGISMTTWSIAGAVGTYTNARGALITMPTVGVTIRRGIEIGTQTQNLGTEATDCEGLYINPIRRGTAVRSSIAIIGHSNGSTTNAYGVRVESHGVGTNRWSFWGSNKIQCDLSDFICAAAGKGLINVDANVNYWRTYASVTGTTAGNALMAIDANGIMSVTRAAAATGIVNLNIQDVGGAPPTT